MRTPKDLDEVIFDIACFRPPEGKTPQVYWRGIIRDYMVQKFGVAMLKVETPAEQKLLDDLWTALTGEKSL